ncbi:hypothetical protein [Lysinibacillus capsici]|uniref:hypothetical protein n=1 Tax=Lysinibacillus capsici TaxID=2115968 RepID=UPI000E1FFAA8|nr:hypothetical protein [Lysinibacillus capsici]RDV25337.1 hypothetical protein C7B89_22785 [Lysinibacillus capsici]
MKALLNVKGTKLSVLAIHYRKTGEPYEVYAMDENSRESLFIEKTQSQYDTRPHMVVDSLGELLEYPELEERLIKERNALITHLDETLEHERNELAKLTEKPFNFKLSQNRVRGIAEAIEEVIAFYEGRKIEQAIFKQLAGILK